MAKPDFNMMVPIEFRDNNGRNATRWVRFGSLWRNRNGDGFNGTIDFFPAGAGNRIVLMPPKPEASGEAAAEESPL